MLCALCANIDLNNDQNGYRYALLDSQQMQSSSTAGCEGCNTFLRLAEACLGKSLGKSDPTWPRLHVVLRRYGAEDNRVDLEFTEDRDASALRGVIGLRLCTAYGVEPSLQASYKRKDEYVNGNLVSENLVPDGLFLGRIISPHAGDRDCLNLAAGWLERCSRQHDHCAEQKDVDLPTRLVYVPEDDNQYLQVQDTAGRRGRYVALSHCWGSGIAFATTIATLNAKHSGFPLEMLARNFQDAARLTRRLGFQYLWIDALCIVQDSLSDWASESSKMAEVYGNASLMISADLAPHSDFGILHSRNIITSHQFGPHNEFCLQARGPGWAAMPNMPLTRRGWAFQERVLSPRTLHFLDEQTAWECDTTVYLEEHHSRQIGHSAHFSKHNLIWILQQPPNSKRDRGPLQLVESSKSNSISLYERVLNWNVCISELAVRFFTNDSDKLPSLSGLASHMQAPELGTYLAGVWEGDPFLSMSWFPRWPQKPQAKYSGPSWSWVATVGQLMWYKGRDLDPTPAEERAWETWNSRFAPKLLSHHILHANVDLKGEVMEGSYIVVRGFCRKIYIREIPESRFNEWEWIEKNTYRSGRKVHMDSRSGSWRSSSDSKSYFSEDLENIEETIDKESFKSCTCFQIAREKARGSPKILALILESVIGTKESFRRVGLLLFDDPSEDSEFSKWEIKTLSLI